MPHPTEGNTEASGLSQADGSFAIIELLAVTQGSAEIDDVKYQELSQRVNYGRREFSAIIDDIQAQGEVIIFEDQVADTDQ
jgi:hypothetical protein